MLIYVRFIIMTFMVNMICIIVENIKITLEYSQV